MHHILVLDQDIETANMVEAYLRRDGYTVSRASTPLDAWGILEQDMPDLFLIDSAYPMLDGLAFCRRLRGMPRSAGVPILITGPNMLQGVTSALEAGGDDYLAKPFMLRELGARIRAHLRRVTGTSVDPLPTVRLMPQAQVVYIDERPVELTHVEFELLAFLCQRPNQLHSTEDLLTCVWQYPRGTGDAALVRNHIRNLRRKVEPDPDRPFIIQSRHGRGYAVRARVSIENGVAQM
jgi:DNA-binding response OmpR family regulator